MSFNKVENEVNQLQTNIATINIQYNTYIQNNQDVDYNDTSIDPNIYLTKLQPTYDLSTTTYNTIQTLQPILHKYIVKANETDTDKQIYGSNQVKKILATNQLYHELTEQFEPIYDNINNTYNNIKSICNVHNNKKQIEYNKQQAIEQEQKRIQDEQDRLKHIKQQRIEQEKQIQLELEQQRRIEADKQRQYIEAQKHKEIEYKQQQELIKQQQYEQEQKDRQERNRLAEESKLRQDKNNQHNTYIQTQRQYYNNIQSSIESFNNAVNQLMEHNTNNNAATVLQQLSRYIRKILNSPLDESCRTIDSNDNKLQQRILQYQYGQDCLLSLGFKLVDNNQQQYYVMSTTAEQWNLLQSANNVVVDKITQLNDS